MTSAASPFRIGFLLFPGLTQLDLTGPYEVLARLPGAEVHLAWKTLEPVRSEHGLAILPTTTLADCPRLDLVCVPGGGGVNALLEDAEVLGFLRRAAGQARYVTSVCTGSLLLGAAGLLRGRRATSHWLSRDLLREFGAEPAAERVVVDGTVITGGGVTAGIDFALRVVAEIAGPQVAQAIQLGIEYDPDPPFAAGSPERAPAAVRQAVTRRAEARQRDRAERVARAARRLPAAE
jgi:cyclohexyl-isocyanide hydratase